MIVIGQTLISDEVVRTRFACDLPRCLGACCVEGEAGAPLEMEEISQLEDHIALIKPFMTREGCKVVDEQGVFDYDEQGAFVTPLVHGKECAFVFLSDKIARCAIEHACEMGAIPFHKPVSCHLYPVRITRYKAYDALNYHRWHICDKALSRGKSEGIYLYEFLKEALIRKFGQEWYANLCQEALR